MENIKLNTIDVINSIDYKKEEAKEYFNDNSDYKEIIKAIKYNGQNKIDILNFIREWSYNHPDNIGKVKVFIRKEKLYFNYYLYIHEQGGLKSGSYLNKNDYLCYTIGEVKDNKIIKYNTPLKSDELFFLSEKEFDYSLLEN